MIKQVEDTLGRTVNSVWMITASRVVGLLTPALVIAGLAYVRDSFIESRRASSELQVQVTELRIETQLIKQRLELATVNRYTSEQAGQDWRAQDRRDSEQERRIEILERSLRGNTP